MDRETMIGKNMIGKKVRVENDIIARAIQLKLFELGFGWRLGGKKVLYLYNEKYFYYIYERTLTWDYIDDASEDADKTKELPLSILFTKEELDAINKKVNLSQL